MEQINLYDLIKYYVKKWRLILVLTIAGLLAGLVYNTFIQVPEYKSDAKLLFVSLQATQTATGQTLLNNYVDLIQSRRVLEPVIVKQNNAISYDKLVQDVSAVNQKDTSVIDITVTTKNAKQSADITNEITDSFKSAVNTLYQSNGVIVVDKAVEPSSASNVNKLTQLGIATLAGFLIAIVIAFFTFDYQRSHPAKKTKKAKKPAVKKTVAKPVTKKKTPASTRKS